MNRIFRIIQSLLFVLTAFIYAENSKEEYLQKAVIINDTTRMDVNNIDLLLKNNGLTAHTNFYPNGTNLSFLWEGGFATSGYVNNDLRVSWMRSVTLEWQPGKWGMVPEDTLARFYVVEQSNGFGSQAYINWADAVSLGADFQDLNGDGVYDPFVDKPDILGDRTIWTVFNDGEDSLRYVWGYKTLPMGLEIHQTIWAFTQPGPLADVIFFRYRLINTHTNNVDSLIFSLVTDSDLGDPLDDLTGCNPELQLGYNYNDGSDIEYGVNPPAFGMQILQGAIVDSPGDTAFRYLGPFWGTDTFPDKKNLLMTSYMPFDKAPTPFGTPQDSLQARYIQTGGLDRFGTPIHPATWGVGGTASDDPGFAFSGDPVTGGGWLDDPPRDRRQLVSSGPFQLAVGDTQDIIVSYTLGQGNNALESIIVMRENAQAALEHIGTPIIVGIKDYELPVTGGFLLYQNHPNPFNPSTTVSYFLANSSRVILRIYNLLGQEVRILIDEYQPAGSKSVVWDGRDKMGRIVSSGIYIYRLEVNDKNRSRKMVFLR